MVIVYGFLWDHRKIFILRQVFRSDWLDAHDWFSLLRKTSRNSCHDTIVSAIKFCISELGGGLWSTRVKPGIPEHSRRYYAVTRLRGYCIKWLAECCDRLLPFHRFPQNTMYWTLFDLGYFGFGSLIQQKLSRYSYFTQKSEHFQMPCVGRQQFTKFVRCSKLMWFSAKILHLLLIAGQKCCSCFLTFNLVQDFVWRNRTILG